MLATLRDWREAGRGCANLGFFGKFPIFCQIIAKVGVRTSHLGQSGAALTAEPSYASDIVKRRLISRSGARFCRGGQKSSIFRGARRFFSQSGLFRPYIISPDHFWPTRFGAGNYLARNKLFRSGIEPVTKKGIRDAFTTELY